jgi:hypothetical protein
MIWVTEIITGNKFALNPKYVVAVFTVFEGEHAGKTSINLAHGSGSIIVDESDLEIVSMLGTK